jgi:uncharacterized membrane protein
MMVCEHGQEHLSVAPAVQKSLALGRSRMFAFVNSFAGAAVRPSFTHGVVKSSRPSYSASTVKMAKSESIPFLEAQPNLNKNYPGYTGFDPVGLSNCSYLMWSAELLPFDSASGQSFRVFMSHMFDEDLMC